MSDAAEENAGSAAPAPVPVAAGNAGTAASSAAASGGVAAASAGATLLAQESLEVIKDVEAQARVLSQNFTYVTGSVQNTLAAVTSILAEHMGVYAEGVSNVERSIDAAHTNFHALMEQCKALDEHMAPIYDIHNNVYVVFVVCLAFRFESVAH